MNRKVRKVLDTLDRELCGRGVNRLNDEERKALWQVLTALRGPDDGDFSDKHHVTCRVRRAALPRMADQYDADNLRVGASFGNSEDRGQAHRANITARRDNYGDTPHFVRHGQGAFEALGLEW